MAVVRRPFALSALLRSFSARIFTPAIGFSAENSSALPAALLSTRNYAKYGGSPFVSKITEKYQYDIVKNPPEWEFVERLLPFDTVPKITPKESFPSGWVPPKEEALNLPYFIPRTKNHQVAIYLKISARRGLRRTSRIRRIEGDIWQLNEDIRNMLQTKHGKYIQTRVHELARFIEVKGDYVLDIKDWAYSKGF